MPKTSKKKTETKSKKSTEEVKEVEEAQFANILNTDPIVSVAQLDTTFKKAELKNPTDLFVAQTEQDFVLKGKEYKGLDYYLIMLGVDGKLFAVEKSFFDAIAKII